MAKEKKKRKIPATFVVTVKDCQNGSWQGTIQWIESREERAFRSTLELIRLMDSAIPHEKNTLLDEDGDL